MGCWVVVRLVLIIILLWEMSLVFVVGRILVMGLRCCLCLMVCLIVVMVCLRCWVCCFCRWCMLVLLVILVV